MHFTVVAKIINATNVADLQALLLNALNPQEHHKINIGNDFINP